MISDSPLSADPLGGGAGTVDLSRQVVGPVVVGLVVGLVVVVVARELRATGVHADDQL